MQHKTSLEPCFDTSDHTPNPTPFLIGVAGGSASGKITVCQKILEQLGGSGLGKHGKKVLILSQDSFYKDLTQEEHRLAASNEYNFDHPDSFDKELIIQSLRDLSHGKTIQVPIYDFKTNKRTKERMTVYPSDVILFEGILILYEPVVRAMLNLKIFVDVDSDLRLSRRILRDMSERGRTLESILKQYATFVKPCFEEFTLPTKKHADVIIPRGVENMVAINLIVQHISNILSSKNPVLYKTDKIKVRRFSEPDKSSDEQTWEA